MRALYQDEPLGGWRLRRTIDGMDKADYRFDQNYVLRAGVKAKASHEAHHLASSPFWLQTISFLTSHTTVLIEHFSNILADRKFTQLLLLIFSFKSMSTFLYHFFPALVRSRSAPSICWAHVFSCDRGRWCMTLIFDLDTDKVKLNQLAKYLGQTSFIYLFYFIYLFI